MTDGVAGASLVALAVVAAGALVAREVRAVARAVRGLRIDQGDHAAVLARRLEEIARRRWVGEHPVDPAGRHRRGPAPGLEDHPEAP